MKKGITWLLAVAMLLSLSACATQQAEQTDVPVQPEVSEATAPSTTVATPQTEAPVVVDTRFVLAYPEDMQALGFTDTLVLDQAPERIVCLSTTPVLALHALGANIVGVPISTVVLWPEDLVKNSESVTFSVMGENYDFEAVLALEPDLVLLASAARDTAGAALESLGVTVYYVYAGHTVSYESVKMQTQALVDAFDMTPESVIAGRELMARFDALEARLTQTRSRYAGLTALVLQSNSPTSHYAQTKNGTLGSMVEMIGFENVYRNEGASLAQVDMEQMLSYDPDYLFCVGSGSADYQRELMQQAFEKNPDYWNAIAAVREDRVICLDVSYVSSAGIYVIEKIEGLLDIVETALGG